MHNPHVSPCPLSQIISKESAIVPPKSPTISVVSSPPTPTGAGMNSRIFPTETTTSETVRPGSSEMSSVILEPPLLIPLQILRKPSSHYLQSLLLWYKSHLLLILLSKLGKLSISSTDFNQYHIIPCCSSLTYEKPSFSPI